MKKGKLSFKRITLVASLALAGFFGVTAGVVNRQANENPIVEEAKATDMAGVYSGIEGRSTPKDVNGDNKIYIGMISNWFSSWSGGVNFEDSYIWTTDHSSDKKISEASWASVSTQQKTFGLKNFDLIEVDYTVGTTTNITWLAKSGSAGENAKTVPINPQFYSVNGKANTYIINTNYDNNVFSANDMQRGFWTYLENDTTLEDCENLYFSPSKEWADAYWTYGGCWPYLVAYDGSGNIVYECGAADIVDRVNLTVRTRGGTGQGEYIYKFINVPKSGISTMRVYHWSRAYVDNEKNYAVLDSSKWTSGQNFFGMKGGSDGSYVSVGNTYSTVFYDNEARAFIRGDFAKYDMDWTMDLGTNPPTSSNPGGPILPVEEFSFTKRGENLFRLSVAINKDESFTYHPYDYIKYSGSSGCFSSWAYNTLGEYDYDNLSNIQVYDERINSESPVGDKSKYIVEGQTHNGNVAIKFIESGFVELRRTTNSAASSALQIRYKNTFAVVGSGSFVNKFEWATAGGVEMQNPTDPGNVAELTNQFFEEGDVFQVTNNTHWSGWGDFVSSKTYFSPTTLDTTHGVGSYEITINVGTAGSWWWGDSAKTRVVTTHTDSSHNATYDFDINDTSTSCKFKVYTDLTDIKVCRLVGSSEHNVLSISSLGLSVPTNYAKKCFITIYTWTNDGGGCNFVIYNGDSQPDGDNIKVNKTGYYSLYLNTSFKLYINALQEFLKDDAVYLDFNGKWPYLEDAGAWYCALFVNSSDVSLAVQLYDVQGRTGDARVIKEAAVPEIEGSNPVKVLWLRLNPTGTVEKQEGDFWSVRLPYDNDKWHIVWNQTVDQSFNMGYNLFRMENQSWQEGSSDYGKYTLSSTGYITNKARAEYYGTYFNSQVICDDGVHKPSNWTNVSTEYTHMCKNAQGVVWLASTEGTTQLAIALSKYDYIIKKYGTSEYDDFINRLDSRSGSTILHGLANKTNGFNILKTDNITGSAVIIIVASSISILSITALSVLLVKKRKSKEQ